MATFFLRFVLFAAALVFAASLAIVFTLAVAAWLLRMGWARLTGQPVRPFVTRFRVRDGFDKVWQRGGQASRTPRADSVLAPRRGRADIIDVEPK
ncbi:MAG: hypothetical protein HY854_00405 [Burkholderiales bacterium]|nr:hypothetical protein [Burkholderiales bacterium]